MRRIEDAHWHAARRLAWTTLGPGDQLRDQLHTRYGTWNVDDIYDTVDSLAAT